MAMGNCIARHINLRAHVNNFTFSLYLFALRNNNQDSRRAIDIDNIFGFEARRRAFLARKGSVLDGFNLLMRDYRMNVQDVVDKKPL